MRASATKAAPAAGAFCLLAQLRAAGENALGAHLARRELAAEERRTNDARLSSTEPWAVALRARKQAKMIAALRKLGSGTAKDIAAEAGCCVDSVYKHMPAIIASGSAKRVSGKPADIFHAI